MQVTTAEKKTYEDYALLPEGAAIQLIDGEFIMSPAPGIFHQKISGRLYSAFDAFVSTHNRGTVLYAPVDVYFADTETFQPDIVFISRERLHIIKEERIEEAPDIVIEILSPTTGYYDLSHKKDVYEGFGVKEYIIVDPKEESVELLANSPNGFVRVAKVKGAGSIESSVLRGRTLDVGKLFASI